MNQYDYIEAGLKVFGLNGATNGRCNCGKEDCEALYKHPISSNWQHTPHWSDEQLETMEEMEQFSTGFGVLVDNLLIIDVDARNGGVESFNKLCADLKMDFLGECGFAVATGSGGGSMHLYFCIDDGLALKQHHNDYPGIDFKSSGFVVGCGSLHASGNTYEEMHGHPDDIQKAPSELVELLKKQDSYRVKTSFGALDINETQIIEVLSFIDPDCDYDTWIRCGMAIHHALGGNGLELWDTWSAKGAKYKGSAGLERHWHSFGKSSSAVTIGTIIHLARAEGYEVASDFVVDETLLEDEHQEDGIDISGVDVTRPPDFAGELCQWINAQCRYPREHLAVAATLNAIGNLAGMRHVDAHDYMTANLLSFCVAGSSTGKEAIQGAFMDIMRAAGISQAVHGGIKSEQEIIRNLTRNQAAFYSIDEMGIVLSKILNAGKKGGAVYLEGVIGLIMSIYSKADSFLPVGGDIKQQIKDDLIKELALCRKKVDENEDKTGQFAERIPTIERALSGIDSGIEKPFLSLIGYTTPVTFNSLIEYESATNGFLARALIFEEQENNPKRKKHFKRSPMPDSIKSVVYNLYNNGSFDAENKRVEYIGQPSKVITDDAASDMLDKVYDFFWTMAEDAKNTHGLEAVPRRGYELAAKISYILAIPSGVRTVEHVRWSFALVKRDIERKIRLAYANMNEKEDPTSSLAAKIQNILQQEPQTQGVIINRCRPFKKDEVAQVLETLLKRQFIEKTHIKKIGNKKAHDLYSIKQP